MRFLTNCNYIALKDGKIFLQFWLSEEQSAPLTIYDGIAANAWLEEQNFDGKVVQMKPDKEGRCKVGNQLFYKHSRGYFSTEQEFEDVVHVLNRLEATRGEYSFEELSGEPPQAVVTCYDQYDNEIDEIRFYDNFVMVDKKLYKISNTSYRKLGGLCERYGKCRIIEV